MERITFEDIPQILGQILEKIEQIEDRLSASHSSQFSMNEVMDIHEASSFLKIPVATIYAKVSKREIPVNKPGKRLCFEKSALIQWLAKSRLKTVDELKQEGMKRLKSFKPLL